MKRYSQKELTLFKSKLLAMKEVDLSQLSLINKQINNLSENGNDDNGFNATNYFIEIESLLVKKSRIKKHIHFIDNALMRIEKGIYGVCAETGLLIDKKRLLAVPTTTLSMEGKKIREKRIIV